MMTNYIKGTPMFELPNGKFDGKCDHKGGGKYEIKFLILYDSNISLDNVQIDYDFSETNDKVVIGKSKGIFRGFNPDTSNLSITIHPLRAFKVKATIYKGAVLNLKTTIAGMTHIIILTYEQMVGENISQHAIKKYFPRADEPIPIPIEEPDQEYLVATFIKGSYLIAALISMLWFKSIFKVFTHVQCGLSSMLEDLSATFKGLIYIDREEARGKARAWREIRIPLTPGQVKLVKNIFKRWLNSKYDFYFYVRRALNVFLILTIPWLVYSLVFGNWWAIGSLGILYIPLNLFLWIKSKKTWACSEFFAYLLAELGIDFGYSKWTQADPDDEFYKLKIAIENKLNKWELGK